MSSDNEVIRKLTAQTTGGHSILHKFFVEFLNEKPGDLRDMELTYFALSITTIFFLQYSDNANKKELMEQVVNAILSKKLSSINGNSDLDQALKMYEQRLEEYSNLVSNLYRDDADESPVLKLFLRLYKAVLQKSADNEVFRTGKAGKIISRYIIDNVKFAQKEYRTE